MTTVLVTGAHGFIGRHVVEALARRPGLVVRELHAGSSAQDLSRFAAEAHAVIHLAGANRPPAESDFARVNVGVTEALCAALRASERRTPVVFTSSTQALLENPYGRSKREAERLLELYAEESGAPVTVFRLTNVFGKWARPNYNSFVATLCHGVACGEPYRVDDRSRLLRLVYVDDVVAGLLAAALDEPLESGFQVRELTPVYETTIGDLVATVETFAESRTSLMLPQLQDRFVTSLYATYLSYLPETKFDYELLGRHDARGSLAEFIKSPAAGQIFVSRTLPGVTRGDHYHHTKTEKFLVVEGSAIVRLRHIERRDVIEIPVDGREFRVVDIPPGYTHSIQNVGEGEMVCVFWASEIFDPARPDTVFNVPVLESVA